MPRSRRRKGAKPSLHEQQRRQLQQHVVPRRYYDPGASPRPSTKMPQSSMQQQTRRHNYQRGS